MKQFITAIALIGCMALPPAFAQTRHLSAGVVRISAGKEIPVASAEDTFYLNSDKTYRRSLAISEDIYDQNGNLAIPEGSTVSGVFKPVRGGLKFYADSLETHGNRYRIRATSQTIHDQKDPRYYQPGAIAGHAALGAGGGALIGLLTGGVSTGGVLAGAAAGAVVGNVTAPQVVVIDDNHPVTLRLQSSVTLDR
jgi:hypothetical protein